MRGVYNLRFGVILDQRGVNMSWCNMGPKGFNLCYGVIWDQRDVQSVIWCNMGPGRAGYNTWYSVIWDQRVYNLYYGVRHGQKQYSICVMV